MRLGSIGFYDGDLAVNSCSKKSVVLRRFFPTSVRLPTFVRNARADRDRQLVSG
jgi:hypothetical protein